MKRKFLELSQDEVIKALKESEAAIADERIPLQTDYANKYGEHYILVDAKNYNEEVSFKEVPYKSRANDDGRQK